MNKYKFIFLKNIKVFFIIFIIISLFIFFIFPQEVFAMEPNTIIDYYGKKEYVGTDTYNHFHPDPAPDIDNIQSSINKPYGPIIEDD
jgi:hypothetical protein